MPTLAASRSQVQELPRKNRELAPITTTTMARAHSSGLCAPDSLAGIQVWISNPTDLAWLRSAGPLDLSDPALSPLFDTGVGKVEGTKRSEGTNGLKGGNTSQEGGKAGSGRDVGSRGERATRLKRGTAAGKKSAGETQIASDKSRARAPTGYGTPRAAAFRSDLRRSDHASPAALIRSGDCSQTNAPPPI